jgi:uncharacterized membrane protein
MPTFIAGLPLHPLVVHAVVVLVPLAVVAGIAVALRPSWRRRLGWPVVALAVVATAAIPVATSTGESLRDRLAPSALIAAHAELGDQLLAFMAPMTIALAALVLLDHRTRRAEGPGAMVRSIARWTRPATIVLTVGVIGLAVVSAVQVVRIGDSGARAVWRDTHYVAPTHHENSDD